MAEKKSIFEDQFKVIPGRDGSFVVSFQEFAGANPGLWGFTSVRDMIAWLTKEADKLVERKP